MPRSTPPRNAWFLVPAACIAVAPAYAAQYLTVEQAQRLMFPESASFVSAPLALSAEQRRAIDTAAHARATAGDPMVWRAMVGDKSAGWFIVDEVIGKVERITYAVSLTPEGAVRAIEILDYRETHGYEVRNAAWRRQFNGKVAGKPPELDDDIKNISGATLSCRHITDGVRRLLVLHETVLKRS